MHGAGFFNLLGRAFLPLDSAIRKERPERSSRKAFGRKGAADVGTRILHSADAADEAKTDEEDARGWLL